MNVPALIANEAFCGRVRPVNVEETRDRSVELRVTAVKCIVSTHLANEHLTLNLVRFRFLFGEKSHASNIAPPEKQVDYKAVRTLEPQSSIADKFFRLFKNGCGAKFAVRSRTATVGEVAEWSKATVC